MNFPDQARQDSQTACLALALSEAKGLPAHESIKPVTLSEAKGLRDGPRCVAAQILRFAQDDRASAFGFP